jgi:hypothetical protein
MQHTEQAGNLGRAGRQRVEAVVQTLATLGCRGESLAEVAHDARNMVTALGLYCDLLEEPGVLAVPFAHYGSELRLVAAASRRLVEKLVSLDVVAAGVDAAGVDAGGVDGSMAEGWPESAGTDARAEGGAHWEPDETQDGSFARILRRGLDGSLQTGPVPGSGTGQIPGAGPAPASNPDRPLRATPERADERDRRWDALFAEPVKNLAAELLANRNLLSALAGPGIAVTVDAEGGARPVRLSAEDLTRLLVNLVKNAAEAMSAAGGRIQITVRERETGKGAVEGVVLVVEDNGPGIAAGALERIFESGFSTHARNDAASPGWPVGHRGLGLAIARSIVETSGGRISASNRPGPGGEGGARFEIELPVRKT